MIIFYIRHGDPIYDPDQLTPLGQRQAESVAHRLALFGVDEIYASTSNRAIQTAIPTCEILGKKVHTLDFLNEDHLGALMIPSVEKGDTWVWCHPTYEQVLTESSVREMGEKWYEHPMLEQFHFDRTIHPINEQLDAFLASHGYEHDTEKGLYKIISAKAKKEKRIAIFAHECVGKIVMSHLLDIPFPYYAAHFEMHTSAITVIRLDAGSYEKVEKSPFEYARARVLSLSNDSHLYRDGLPLVHRTTYLMERY